MSNIDDDDDDDYKGGTKVIDKITPKFSLYQYQKYITCGKTN